MKLSRLESTTQRPSRESVERVQQLTDERIRRVEAGEGVAADRERSLSQEVALTAPETLVGFEAEASAMQTAKDLADALTRPDAELDHLIRPEVLPDLAPGVDDEA